MLPHIIYLDWGTHWGLHGHMDISIDCSRYLDINTAVLDTVQVHMEMSVDTLAELDKYPAPPTTIDTNID